MVKRASQILNGAEEKAMLESEAALRPKLLENLLDKDYERQEDREGATEIQEKDEGVLDEHAPLPPLTWKNILWFMGPGWLVSIAYVDPGNYQADISSGKATGYVRSIRCCSRHEEESFVLTNFLFLVSLFFALLLHRRKIGA